MEATLENFISNILINLRNLADERLPGISQLLKSGCSIMPLGILKEIKPNVQDLATSAPSLFFNAAALYYAKFIQLIEVTNLADEWTLIPQYLKLIGIMKNLCNGENHLKEVNFEPWLKLIIDSIKEVLFSYETIEKTFAFLNILKEIEKQFDPQVLAQKEQFEFIDLGIQEYVGGEEDLIKSYFTVKTIKEGWGFDLFYSEGSWIEKARSWLEEESIETCDKILVKSILNKLNSFTNKYYPEIEDDITRFCEKFEMDSSNIKSLELLEIQNLSLPKKDIFLSSEFSPIFEDHWIGDNSQIEIVSPILKLWSNEGISIFEYKCLLNENHICIKIFKEGNSDIILNQYQKEKECYEKLSSTRATIYLKYFGTFDYKQQHFIIIELCKCDLSKLIPNNVHFSDNDLAYFAYLFIEALSDLKKKNKIYHRDIKPANIVISQTNEFKLIDFNISDNIDEPSDSHTLELPCKGTPSDAAAEIYRGLQYKESVKYSRERADVYSLGLVILQMAKSELLSNEREDVESFNQRIKIYIANSRPQTSWFKELLDKMLEENYKNRPRFEWLLNFIKSNEEFMKCKEGYKKDWVSGLNN
ncbi:unnamed protein product [Blepharisma stoltei]|uniref:Protein kinase domain-containing protein n=1 Tax=Blepharisma stoltei TaxID=1481888 RepID=A0AAU9JW90_9CILI|nr:unnamed protein product [Blepharisma stoltei]